MGNEGLDTSFPSCSVPMEGEPGSEQLCSAPSGSRRSRVCTRTLEPVHQYFTYAGVWNLHFHANPPAARQVHFLISIHHPEIQ